MTTEDDARAGSVGHGSMGEGLGVLEEFGSLRWC